jgi:hypothetical protein
MIKGSDNMQISKWAWLIVGNCALGLITCYTYVLLWVLFFLDDPVSIFSLNVLISLIIGIFIFVIWNKRMIKHHGKKYWFHSFFTYAGTILLFTLLFQSI